MTVAGGRLGASVDQEEEDLARLDEVSGRHEDSVLTAQHDKVFDGIGTGLAIRAPGGSQSSGG